MRQIAGTRLLYIGDAKMAAQSTREAITVGGDDYLTRLPKPARRNEMEACVDRALDGEVDLVTIFNEDGSVFDDGYDFEREVAGETSRWTERVIVYRSDAHADGQRGKFQERLAKATEAIKALTPPVGCGKRPFREVKDLTAAIGRIEKRYRVQGLQQGRDGDRSRSRPERHHPARGQPSQQPQGASPLPGIPCPRPAAGQNAHAHDRARDRVQRRDPT